MPLIFQVLENCRLKAKLRRKNRLMHVGRLDEADALAKQIAKDISKSTKSRLVI